MFSLFPPTLAVFGEFRQHHSISFQRCFVGKISCGPADLGSMLAVSLVECMHYNTLLCFDAALVVLDGINCGVNSVPIYISYVFDVQSNKRLKRNTLISITRWYGRSKSKYMVCPYKNKNNYIVI